MEENDTNKFPGIIELNVGGVKYSTTLLTLTKRTDTMLAVMFGGKFDIQKDDEGRYFIDADGEMFCHILRYLRYDEIPPYSLCEKVYKDACYFGIRELVEKLENAPPLVGRKMKEKFLCRIEGFDAFVNDILKHAIKLEHLGCTSPISCITITLYHKKVSSTIIPDFDVDHKCFQKSTDYFNKEIYRSPQVHFGPWSLNLSEEEVMKILMDDLDDRKFVCNYNIYTACHYKCEIPMELRAQFGDHKSLQCKKQFYVVNFHWSKM